MNAEAQRRRGKTQRGPGDVYPEGIFVKSEFAIVLGVWLAGVFFYFVAVAAFPQHRQFIAGATPLLIVFGIEAYRATKSRKVDRRDKNDSSMGAN